MPLYDFVCRHEGCSKQNSEIELLAKSSDKPQCTECFGDLERLPSRPGKITILGD